METLQSLFPTADHLLAVSPEDLAPVLLMLARERRQGGGMFWPDGVAEITVGQGMAAEQQFVYPFHKKAQVEALLNEAWEGLRKDGLIMPAPGMNGKNGWMVLTKDGETISSADDFARLRAARDFPKSLLHPKIVSKVAAALMRGDLGEAVFGAFRAVEESVRDAGGYAATDIGVPLMRKAFDAKTGKLTDPSHPEAEREALAHLFAGAIGSYKNPHSHRTVNLTDVREAQEQVLLATHLLRIVDARRKG